ncbi:pectin lyase fold/virulence factor [Bisporella sp. PMI_857]|nr:pectin lyase fold/virulence factor [Bisporella sp. PMI_857]
MAMLRFLVFLSLLVLGQAIQFEIPEVAEVVHEIKLKYSEYFNYDGSNINANLTTRDNDVQCRQSSTPYWYEQIAHRGVAATGPAGYSVYRNVKDYGAKGDGVTDDTAAINAAISAGGRCGRGCTTTSTTPALIGNPNNPPVLKARADFQGFGIIDGNPYWTENLNWISTNVFLRQATGIHWPTSQATSLQNVVFELSRDAGNRHTGLFCESGSAGFLSDLTFNGGIVGASIGNQQFTMRNLVFNGCGTAISISINNCGIGLDITAGGSSAQNVGSVIMIDSTITNTPIGITTSFTTTSSPATAGTAGATVLAGGTLLIQAWGQGNRYTPNGPQRFQGSFTPVSRPTSLLSSNGRYYTQSKPQYNTLGVASFVSVRNYGATGNANTDDTAALQNAINAATSAGQILYVDCGMYKVTSTIFIPAGARIVGEGYATILSSGSFFNDMNNPKPVVKVGNAGDTGRVEWSDMIVSGQGQQQGAVLIEWNLASPSGTPSGMWDVHTRVGGIAGSNLQVAQCLKQPSSTVVRTACIGAYQLMRITTSASGLYMENVWLWTADHDVDDQGLQQIDVYVGRGLNIESTAGNIWLVGTGVEHNTLYQYQLYNTQKIYLGFAQIETPYYQPNPQAPHPSPCAASGIGGNCRSAWGLRIVGSQDILAYGAGLYSFFDNWSTTCSNNPGPENCQANIFSLEGTNTRVTVYCLATVGTTNMITQNGGTLAYYADNQNVYPQVIALFRCMNSLGRS